MVETRSKRPLAEADANVPPPKAAKKNSGSSKKQSNSQKEKQGTNIQQVKKKLPTPKKDPKSFKPKAADGLVQYNDNEARIKISGEVLIEDDDPYEYICMARTSEDRERENDLKPASQQLSREQLRKQHNASLDGPPKIGDPAKDYPGHKWIIMRNSWDLMSERKTTASYCCPDAFDMYIWNDWEGYGLLEIVENFVADFHAAFVMPESKNRLRNMWFPLAALLHWIAIKESIVDFTCGDDSGAVVDILALIGRAFVTMLNALERAGELKPDSSFKDLALVISLALIFLDEYMDEDSIGEVDDEDIWTQEIMLYAKNFDIDLLNSGVSGIKELIELNTESARTSRKWPGAGSDRWSFAKAVSKSQD